MPGAAGGGSGFCWRPWPCPDCNQGLTPVGYLFRRSETNPAILAADEDGFSVAQIEELLAWVKTCPHTQWQRAELPKLAEGSEHEVYLNEADATVFKITRLGTFGESYYLVNGLIHQRKCTLAVYLIRLRLWERLFGSAPTALGISPKGQIVSRQKYIEGNIPEQESVNLYLELSGLTAVKRECFVWKRAYEGLEIWVGDTRDENFVATIWGIVPIDIRVWLAYPDEDVT